MKHRLPWLLPTATSIVLCALLIGLSMGASGAYFTDQVTIEGISLQAGYWVTPTPTPTPAQVAATVTVNPKQVNKNDTIDFVAHITLPAGYGVGEIDTGSILLCLGTVPCSGSSTPTPIGPSSTSTGTGYLDATFGRASVLDLLRGITLPPNGKTYLAVSGRVGSAIFVGSYEIQVQQSALDAAAVVEPAVVASPASSLTPGETATPIPTPSEPPPGIASPAPGDTPPESVAARAVNGFSERIDLTMLD